MLLHIVRIFTAIVIVLLSNYAVVAQPFRQQSPIIISDDLVYVKVNVNGRGPFNFILDSGTAGIGRIDRQLAKEIGLKIIGYQQVSDIYQSKIEILVSVESLGLGQVTQSGLRLMIGDYNTKPKQIRIDGVLSRDFFYNYLLTIDGPTRQLILSKETLEMGAEGVLSYSKAFLIPGKIGQTDLLFNLDTGSNLPLHFPVAKLTGIRYENTLNKREETKASATFMVQEAVIKDELVVGSVRIKNQKVYYSDKAHQINVGEGFLKDHVVTFDQRKRLVRID
ncbi:retropepsin-like aspartic protease [Spirosoma sp.]|uniref:retropepsin-like aspartic protease n=1 Tax=Spirosoma sp. TaxID=1899569 RepID=UPI0026112D00|nr:retropepsin-like aspartic protease [Spirosoma sp.]MCX6213233.1 retropepsin-like aspartic protease [Spirosoma sp.]